MNQRSTLKVNGAGHLEIGGCDAVELAARFGTPLYVFDEDYIRLMMRTYRLALDKYYGGNGMVLYASKAFSCKAIYAVANSENIGVDVVSGGELYTALSAGFPAEKIYMHGNNKTPEELEFAVKSGVGVISGQAGRTVRSRGRKAKRAHKNKSRRRGAHARLCADGHARQQIRLFDCKRHRRRDYPPCAGKIQFEFAGFSLPYRFADLRKAVVCACGG